MWRGISKNHKIVKPDKMKGKERENDIGQESRAKEKK
jgi:hypothetical protein